MKYNIYIFFPNYLLTLTFDFVSYWLHICFYVHLFVEFFSSYSSISSFFQLFVTYESFYEFLCPSWMPYKNNCWTLFWQSFLMRTLRHICYSLKHLFTFLQSSRIKETPIRYIWNHGIFTAICKLSNYLSSNPSYILQI